MISSVDPYEALLAPYACKPSATKGRIYPQSVMDPRNPFQRDRDAIIHSVAFRRLKNKTQVFFVHEGDHFRTRLTHTLEVTHVARNLARSLRVQEDLAEAVALAHDLGHPPFGHTGEDALDQCLKEYGGFDHNDQSMRVVTHLERRYAQYNGLNLSWEVLEGLAKHNGPITKRPLPATIAEIDHQFDLRLGTWASLEAQIGNLSDDIAYNNHDIDDGLRAGFFTVEDLYDLPIVGTIAQDVFTRYGDRDRSIQSYEIVRAFFGLLAADVLAETQKNLQYLKPQHPDEIRMADRAMVSFSDPMLEVVTSVRKFLSLRMYSHETVQAVRRKVTGIVLDLFKHYMDKPTDMPLSWQQALEGQNVENQMRIVTDYVAGMTDSFAMKEYARIFAPYEIEGLPKQ
jgi:dGTPase